MSITIGARVHTRDDLVDDYGGYDGTVIAFRAPYWEVVLDDFDYTDWGLDHTSHLYSDRELEVLE